MVFGPTLGPTPTEVSATNAVAVGSVAVTVPSVLVFLAEVVASVFMVAACYLADGSPADFW